ncbi:MAG: hypothetical protein HS115_13800 [Spirochaetales bacterium]|nr:hypothetical protein [Spirochaetales bacterium]
MLVLALILLLTGAALLGYLAWSVLYAGRTAVEEVAPPAAAEVLVQHREEREEHVELEPAAGPATQKETTLVVGGTLYLDHGRKLHRSRSLDLSPAYFQELKRIGPASLILDGSSFIIHAENASYTYSAADLDRIFFRDRGLALVPLSARRAIPVFLSDQIAVVKSYIKTHSRIKSVA